MYAMCFLEKVEIIDLKMTKTYTICVIIKMSNSIVSSLVRNNPWETLLYKKNPFIFTVNMNKMLFELCDDITVDWWSMYTFIIFFPCCRKAECTFFSEICVCK